MVQNKDDIDWLVLMAETNDDVEIRSEAKKRLDELSITSTDIKERLSKLETHDQQDVAFNKAWQVQLTNNAKEKYTKLEMLKIFLWAPLDLKYFDTGLVDLYRNNYKVKFKQRLILILSSIIFWISLCIGGYKISEYYRMKEIEKVDIHKWEENRIK